MLCCEDYLTLSFSENLSTALLVAYNKVKSSTYMNHGKNETQIQKSKIPRGKYHGCMTKMIRFLSRN